MVFVVLLMRVILHEISHSHFIQGKPPQAPSADETGKLVKFFSVLYFIDRKIIKIKT